MRPGEIAPEVVPEIIGGGVPVGRALGEQLHRDCLERLRDLDATIDEAVGTLLHVFVGDGDRRFRLERRHACEHLVEHHAQRVEVGAAVECLALGLLGGEVGGGAHDRTVLGEGGVATTDEGGGDAEVGDLHVAAVGDEDVAELDVAVDETCGVGGAQRAGDVGRDLGGTIGMQWPGGAQNVGHRPTRHVLHHDVVGAALLPPVIDADDVGVVEVCRSLSLATEPLDEVGVVREFGEEHLERNLTAKETITREVDVGHAATGDVAKQFVSAVENGGSLLGHGSGAYRCMTSAPMHGADRNGGGGGVRRRRRR